MKEQYVEDETPTSEAVEETPGAPGTDAASEENGAPATPPEGFVEEKRYQDLRSIQDRTTSLIDRARQGDAEAARELGFEFAEEEVPDEGDEELAGEEGEVADPVAREWIQKQQIEEAKTQFNAHLDRLAGDPSLLDDHDRQIILNQSLANGFNESATEKAFEAWKERQKGLEERLFQKWKQSKNAPHVSAVGTGATETPYRDDMSTRELTKAAVEQFRLAKEQ